MKTVQKESKAPIIYILGYIFLFSMQTERDVQSCIIAGGREATKTHKVIVYL